MVGIVVSIVLAVSARLGAGSVQAALRALPSRRRHGLVAAALASVAVLLVNVVAFHTRWDVSPFRALPLLCAGVLWYAARQRAATGSDTVQNRSLLVLSVYGLAVLARVILRVPSGGSYGFVPVACAPSALHAPGDALLSTGFRRPARVSQLRPSNRIRGLRDGADGIGGRHRVSLRQH